MEYVQLIIGLAILILSGESLVKGSVSMAIKMRVSTLVIGMTIVSFGTSAPELLVAIKAALKDKPDIAIGAIVGSNVSNIALILGLTAIVFPIRVNRDSIAIDWPMMIIATGLFYACIFNGILGFWEGAILFSALLIFGTWLIWRSRKKKKIEDVESGQTYSRTHPISYLKDLAFIALGCLGLIYGADLFLEGASELALNFGISERIIGLTLVALGTSLPELITSLVAAFRHQADIGIGNLIGSNIFNLLAILGITAMVKEIPINYDIIHFDFYWMLAVSVIIFPMMLIRFKITRLEGFLLLAFYVIYIHFVLIS
ncbi:MAG: calcium/sodium antiporter [Vicingaceae bacterium]